MNLTKTFAELLRHHRESRKMTQEELSERAGLDRTYVSQLERGLKSPTLTSVEKLAQCLGLKPAVLVEELGAKKSATITVANDYLVRAQQSISIKRAGSRTDVPLQVIGDAIDVAHGLIDQLYDVELDIASVLGLRNLSAFVGELFGSAVIISSGESFHKNPHQDGYPDLLLMDKPGLAEWNRLRDRRDEKAPFSPFATGGLEVKATCGAIPTPAVSARRGHARPGLGGTRIDCMTKYDWKAHHRETNNLIGLLWDFIDKRPRIAAVMYSSDLAPTDWGKIVQPKEGGGRTTSVSIMAPAGIRKMYHGWLFVLRRDGYREFLNRKNGGEIIQP